MAELRVDVDLAQIKNQDNHGPIIIFADKIDENFLHIESAIFGPESTPYENAVILVDIKLSDQYPVSGNFFWSAINDVRCFSLHHLNRLSLNERLCIQMLMNAENFPVIFYQLPLGYR